MKRAPDMNREPALLFDHAVASLKQYEYQDVQDKNVVLVEIAQYDTWISLGSFFFCFKASLFNYFR